jgi:hypothetical protein
MNKIKIKNKKMCTYKTQYCSIPRGQALAPGIGEMVRMWRNSTVLTSSL